MFDHKGAEILRAERPNSSVISESTSTSHGTETEKKGSKTRKGDKHAFPQGNTSDCVMISDQSQPVWCVKNPTSTSSESVSADESAAHAAPQCPILQKLISLTSAGSQAVVRRSCGFKLSSDSVSFSRVGEIVIQRILCQFFCCSSYFEPI